MDNRYTCAKCNPNEDQPDVDYCPECDTLTQSNAEHLATVEMQATRIAELEGALAGLFEHCAMVQRYWGDGSNAKQSHAAMAHARRVLEEGGGS